MPPRKSPDGSKAFSGLRFYFLTRAHMQLMMKRVVQHGGTLDEAVVPGATTHIVCPPKTTDAQINAALPASPDTTQDPLSSKYDLVSQQFVAQSIIKGKRLNEADFRPVIIEPVAARAPQPQPPRAAVTPSRLTKKQKLEKSVPEEASTKITTPSSQVRRPTSATRQEKKEIEKIEGDDDEKAEPCVVKRQGSEWVAVQGTKPKYTGGHTGIPWGSYGVWDEPFDPEKARQTVEILRRHWYVPGFSSNTLGTADAVTTTTIDKNGVCPHVACSKRRACLIEQLEDFKKKVYVPGRDQFKIKAIDKAQHMLVIYPKPLEVDSDVDAVGLGTKSTAKVKELLRTGHMVRADNMIQDERHVVYNEFMRVWGSGPTVAEKWYSLGCRTLQDVEKKVEEKVLTLTEQQKCGLKHLNDFEKKIPREEIAIVESIAREATFELVEDLGAPNPEKTYCFATGSYRRGIPESTDIDILVVLPDSMPIQDCREFLQWLLVKLLDEKGVLVDEMGPREVFEKNSASQPSPSASWNGICRLPPGTLGHETLEELPYRRIDVKVYTYQHGPCALNYFANSQAFCRATRHWANTSAPAREAAKKENPLATGFKISDLKMFPRIKRYVSGGKAETVPLEPAVQLTCETDLYEMIGLSYVPVTMRYFNDYF